MSEFECKACDMEFANKDELMEHKKAVHMVDHASAKSVSPKLFVLWGAIGGFLGALGMLVVMMIAGNAAAWPVTMLGVIGFAMTGGSPTAMSTMAVGLVLHLISSVVIGAVLGTLGFFLTRAGPVVNRFLAPVNLSRGATTGILGGIAVFLVYGLPMMMLMLEPALLKIATNMATMQIATMNPGMPSSQVAMMAASMAQTIVNGMIPGLIASFFVAHLVYGIVVGVTIGFGVCQSLRQSAHTHAPSVSNVASRAQ